MTRTTEPLIIVGSRLQALIFAVAAVALPLGLWDQIGWATLLVSAPLALAAALTMHRRVELHTDHAFIRHQFRPAKTIPRGEIEASTGHRYLRLDGQGGRLRVEVPVEIRPEVRNWANRR